MSASVTDEKAVIEIEVELVSKVSGLEEDEEIESGFFAGGHDDIDQIVAEEINATIKEEIEDALEEEGIDMDTIRDAAGLVKDVDSKGISNIKNMAKSPENFMENTFMQVLSRAGPYGALTAAIIAAIAGSPELVKAVVEALGVKGAPLNQDYAFTEEEQYNQQFDRLLQYRRNTNDDPVITVTTKGFVAGDKDFVGNSMMSGDTARTGRITLQQSSLAFVEGV